MAWTITERFPSWGETGEFPTDGFFYEGGDQVNEKHLDALWNGVDVLEGEVRSALQDIDSDEDGVVDKADALGAAATLDGDLSATNGEVIWDESASYIPNARLETTSLTVSGGDGLKDGGSVSLGGTTTLNIEPADFAGAGLEDDGTDDIRIASTAAGDGLKGGSGNALNIEPADFAGSGLQDDGTDNLQLTNNSVTVNAGNQLSGGGSVSLGGSITIDLDETGLNADTVDGQDAGDITTTRDMYTRSEVQSISKSFQNGLAHYLNIVAGNNDSTSVTVNYDDGTSSSFGVSDSDGATIQEVGLNKSGQYVTSVSGNASGTGTITIAVSDSR